MSRAANPRLMVVGGQKAFAEGGPSEDRLQFLGDLFPRLTRDVRHTGETTRFVGFQGSLETGAEMEFLGIEVNLVEEVPAGMVAWELYGNLLRRREPGDRGPRAATELPVRWIWMDTGSTGERLVGEFAPVSAGSGLPDRLRLSANAYVSMLPGGSSDEIELVDYDPSWPEQFERCARWLISTLGRDVAVRVEHYGSTAIPGMPAKPIIDLLVEIPGFEAAMPRVLPRLNNPFWEYWWYKDHLTFVRRDRLGGTRTHHLHMAPRGHALWQGLAFRDYLRAHAADAARYAELKRRLATSYRADRERYTNEKEEFVREIARRAASRASG